MIKLASLFQSGAVLQRDMELPLWGKCAPGCPVECVFDGITSYSRSSLEGNFMLYLPPHPAGGPFELTVSANGETLTLTDILVGEVWLCSGQSNMAYKLSSDWRAHDRENPDPLGRKQERQFNELVMDPERIRFFNVESRGSTAPEEFCRGEWLPVTPEHSGQSSAIASWFALGLQYHLDVPVGLVNTSYGGSSAETWMSEEALWAAPETRELLAAFHRSCYTKDRAYWECDASTPKPPPAPLGGVAPDSGNEGEAWGWASPGFDDTSWADMKVPGSWKAQKIAGNGAVWFRKKVTLPVEWENVPLILGGGTVDKQDISYFNGVEVGRTGKDMEECYWDTKRSYEIPASLVKGGEAVIAIRGFSHSCDGSLGGDWHLKNTATGEKISLPGVWKAKAEYDRGDIAPPPIEPHFPDHFRHPGNLFRSMLKPLIPYGIRGVLWYQGENNTATPEMAGEYRSTLQNLICDWRRNWRRPDLPFIVMQLANFGAQTPFEKDSTWAWLRESQRLTALYDPDTFLATAIDIGDEQDVHPQNKLEAGKRMAAAALHHVYGCAESVPSGPEPEKMEISGSTIRIKFRCAEEMELREGGDCFYIGDSEGDFYAADSVKTDGEYVILSSSQVPDPMEVRYAWSKSPVSRLYNKAALPASSFRLVAE